MVKYSVMLPLLSIYMVLTVLVCKKAHAHFMVSL